MMWQYFWAHVVYHLMRWFPRNNRLKIRIVLIIFSIALLLPQIFVLTRPHTARFCGQSLFELLVVSIVYTFGMIGFSFLFSIMEPVPFEVKVGFHVFGGICFITGLIFTVFTSLAGQCRVYTEELYFFSIASMVLTVVTMAFFAVMVPFWIINRVWRNSVLDLPYRTGICYEPVKCCSCVWHI